MFFNAANVNASFRLEQGAYLEKNQWGALEDILNDWKCGKISTDECAIYGCYVLAAQEPARNEKENNVKRLPSKYKVDKKSREKSPYFFIDFLYKNEKNFGSEAINEFRKSDWCDDEFINEIFSSSIVKEEFNNFFRLPISEQKKIASLTRGRQYYFFDILEHISRTGLLKPESIYIAAMSEFYNYKKFYEKYNVFVGNRQVNCCGDFFNVAIKIIPKIKNTKNRKVINILNFYYNMHCRSKAGALTPNCNVRELFKVSGGIDEAENQLYLGYFEKYYKEICANKGYRKPINFLNNLEMDIRLIRNGLTPPLYGNIGSVSPQLDPGNVIRGFSVNLFLDNIEYQSKLDVYSPEKAVIHELFHTIQVSYFNSVKPTFYWYLVESEKFKNSFNNSTATWAEDYFYLGKDIPKQTVFQSVWYFFDSFITGSYVFPAIGFLCGEEYAMGFFWNYMAIENKEYIKQVFEGMVEKTPSSILFSSTNFLKNFHKFAIKNFLIGRNMGVDPQENLYNNANTHFKPLHANFPKLEIRDECLNSIFIEGQNNISSSILVTPWSSNLIKIHSSAKYFQNFLTFKFTKNKSVQISVIEAWTDVNINGEAINKIKYIERDLETIGDYDYYKYYTKKGINPKYFIIVATNVNKEFFDAEIKFDITVEKPFVTPTGAIASIISDAGERFKNDIVSIFSKNLILNLQLLDSEICKLYDAYKTNPNDYIASQIVQKIKDLNLVMQTSLVAIHDLRYQYYLYKNYCVDKIVEGATSQSIVAQVKKLRDFIDEIKIDNFDNSLNVSNAYIIHNHAQIKLKTLKQVDVSEWDMGQDTYDKINKISKIITGNSKYPYWYTNDELKEAITSPFIGIPEDECPGPMLLPGMPIKGPFPVNYCPGIKRQLDLLKIPNVYSISSKLKSISITVNGTTYNASNMLCVRDKFDPLSLAYFSALKKHRYHEDNMPPVPSVSNIRNYVSLLGYYMKICNSFSLCNNEEFADLKKIMIGGASARIMEIIVLISEAIIKEKQQNKVGLYEKFKQVASESELYTEILDLIEKQLARDGYRDLY